MADPVAVGIDISTFLFLVLLMFGLGGLFIGMTAKNKIEQLLFGNTIKSEIKSELLDKEQTKEIKRLEREIDGLKREKQ